MTAHRLLGNGKRSRRGNRKDGQGRRPKPKFNDAAYEAAGFARCDWNKWSYTISFIIDCPVFVLAPKTHNGQFGLMARCGEKEIHFPKDTDPQLMAQKLDAAILVILNADHQIYVYDGSEKVILKTPVDQGGAVYWVNRLKELRSFGHDVPLCSGIEPVQ